MNAGVEEINLAEVKELPVQIGVPFTNKWGNQLSLGKPPVGD